jgi:uncharacterized membrane protein/uncharacterized protein YwbE
MQRTFIPVLGAGAGAALMYFLDADRGARRRARVRQRAAHSVRVTEELLDKGRRDATNRARGLVRRLETALRKDQATDEVIVGRVRSALGRVCSHPHAVAVTVDQGHAAVSGLILAQEADQVIARLRRVPGVISLEDRLERHESGEGIPALQGRAHPSGEVPELLQEHWTPALRLAALATGLGLGALASLRRGRAGALLGAIGSGLVMRGATDLPAKRLLGVGAGRRAIDLHKTIEIAAPLHDVFEFFRHIERFPRVMQHVREVEPLSDNRSRWVVDGPAGLPVAWEAEITRLEEDHALGWKTIDGATVRHAGVLHFEEIAPNLTRVDMRMSYNPPAGALGHAVASIFHRDPKHELQAELLRVKSLLEDGKTTAKGEEITR